MKKATLFTTLILSSLGHEEVRINEVMASNVHVFPNASDFEDYPD